MSHFCCSPRVHRKLQLATFSSSRIANMVFLYPKVLSLQAVSFLQEISMVNSCFLRFLQKGKCQWCLANVFVSNSMYACDCHFKIILVPRSVQANAQTDIYFSDIFRPERHGHLNCAEVSRVRSHQQYFALVKRLESMHASNSHFKFGLCHFPLKWSYRKISTSIVCNVSEYLWSKPVRLKL